MMLLSSAFSSWVSAAPAAWTSHSMIATAPSGQVIPQVQCPVQFDGRVPDLGRAPDAFQHTDEILTELGKTRAEIASLRQLGAAA